MLPKPSVVAALLAAAALICPTGPTLADGRVSAWAEQLQGDASEEPEIVVVGLKDPFTLSAAQLNGMLNAFYGKRGTFAPGAKLFVELVDLGNGIPESASFTLRGNAAEVVLPRDAQRRIYFPDARPGGGPFRLTSNVSKRRVGISLWVMSPVLGPPSERSVT